MNTFPILKLQNNETLNIYQYIRGFVTRQTMRGIFIDTSAGVVGCLSVSVSLLCCLSVCLRVCLQMSVGLAVHLTCPHLTLQCLLTC